MTTRPRGYSPSTGDSMQAEPRVCNDRRETPVVEVRGADVAEGFYGGAVRPILDRVAPGLPHVAARLGSGSDVLGLDDELSPDHDFGCRLTVLVDDDHADRLAALDDALQRDLPSTFDGRPVRFPVSWDARPWHRVELATVAGFAESRLGAAVSESMPPEVWLSFTGQAVLEVAGGPVFHDSTSAYGRVVAALDWYPHDIWLYVLSSGWARLEQELPFVGRTGGRGDDRGSRLIAARLAVVLVHLAYVLERTWPPYPKWAGLRLPQLATGEELGRHLDDVLAAVEWRTRETALAEAARVLHRRQAQLGLPTPDRLVVPFYDRPFRAIDLAVPRTLRDAVGDPVVRRLPAGVGCFEQWCDNVDLLAHPERRHAARALYLALLQDQP